jgi:hypothetical protein
LIPNYKNADRGKKLVENKHDWVYKAPEQADDFAGFKLRLWQALCPLLFLNQLINLVVPKLLSLKPTRLD